jgi:hypothetical protein
MYLPYSSTSLSHYLFDSGLFSCALYRWVEVGMSGFDYGLLVILALLLGVICELDRIREQIAPRDDFGEPPAS